MPPVRLLHHHLSGPPGEPLLVLGPSLGTSMTVWAPHLRALAQNFRVLPFDLPGHGDSPADLLGDPGPGGTTVADLAALVLDLIDHHGVRQFHYAGISLGGAIGAHLAAHHPERVASLTLICSSAHFGAPGPWRERAALVRLKGTAPLLVTNPGRWFADPRTRTTPRGRALLKSLADADPAGYAACCDALAGYDLRPRLGQISAPTLVIGGAHDVATPPHHAQELAHGIRRATLKIISTGHLAAEEPLTVETALMTHIKTADTG
ncbi:alpha/beta fold hydrolase [Streptomyces sp. NPDC015346]|uniref:alpha/beta fold hydrolase n=1 Tax=Streptomyces sp. NPDC015346 TaxID=3364954 RepID=UPI0036F4BC13